MKQETNKAKNAFRKTVHNEPAIKRKAVVVPKMIKKDQPMPRPMPPMLGAGVDAQGFNQRWHNELMAKRQLNPLSVIDKQPQSLNSQFNQSGDVLDQITSKKRDRGLSR